MLQFFKKFTIGNSEYSATIYATLVVSYQLISKSGGVNVYDLGVKLSARHLGRAFLLIEFVNFWFLTDFRFCVFSFKALTPMKFWMFLKYLPFFALYFIASSWALNMSTRIQGAKEWVNILLILFAIIYFLGLRVFFFILWQELMFWTVPYPSGITSALAWVLLS